MPPTVTTLTTVTYERISLDREGTELGVTRQREDNDKLCADRGWPIAARYRDNDKGASSKSKKRRPDYEQMLTDIESGKLGPKVRIVAWSTSRLTRRPMEYEHLIQLAEQGRIEITTVKSQVVDLTTASGRMIARVLAAVDAQEAEQTGERVARAAQQRREQGRHHRGGRTFGYNRDNTVNLEEAQGIKDGADLILSGKGPGPVLALWRSRGLQTPAGREWVHHGHVTQVYRSGRIAGLTMHRGQPISQGNWEAILDRATWEAVNVALVVKNPTNRRGDEIKHLLAGYIYCGICGARLRTQGAALRYLCIKGGAIPGVRDRNACGGVSRSAAWVEDEVRAFCIEADSRRSAVLAQREPDFDASAEIQRIEGEIAKLMAAYRAEVFTLEEVAPQVAPLRASITRLKDEQERALDAKVRRSHLRRLGPGLGDLLLGDDLAVARAVLARYVSKVEILPVGKGRKPGREHIRITPAFEVERE